MRTIAKNARPSGMLAPLLDPANAITLLGAALSAAGTAIALSGSPHLAIALALVAVALDWIDGVVARRSKSRPIGASDVGPFIDCFADFMSSALVPAVLVIGLNGVGSWQISVLVLVLLCGTIRLSYFNAFGVTDDGKVQGLPIAHNVPILGLVFLLSPLLGQAFAPLIAAITVLLAVLNIGSFYFPRGTDAVMPKVVLGCIILAIGNVALALGFIYP